MYTEKPLLVHKEKELSKDIHIQLIICLDCNHYLHSTEVKQMANAYVLFTLFPNANCIFQIKIIENCTIWLVRTYWHITHTHTPYGFTSVFLFQMQVIDTYVDVGIDSNTH